MTHTIHHGDCLDVLRGMPDNSVDAVVCDPPYGLSNTSPDKVTETIVRWAQGDREYVPQGRGFMGASWDAFVPPVAVWDECLRVLKPGGHLVAFAGSRTQDLMGLAIRLAGFDIRENLAWLYGSGFPKSHNVSLSIDKAQGHANRGRAIPVASTYQASDVEQKNKLTSNKVDAYEPKTPDAEKWSGWGTALKPGHEPIILARKPFPGTVAQNTLTWGTGGLNIDKTRIGMSDADRAVVDNRSTAGFNDGVYGKGMGRAEGKFTSAPAGRWPANVVLDPDTAKALDQQSGTNAGAHGRREMTRNADDCQGVTNFVHDGVAIPKDSGGASRFFKVVEPDPPFMYAAKAPKRERPSYTTEDGQTVQHATVKPLSIMQWLVKLVTPEGGTVLDPFAGSGTTVEAAILEGFHVIGIEREAEYLPLIQQRIDRANDALPMAS